jgi:ATP-dependent Lon protease
LTTDMKEIELPLLPLRGMVGLPTVTMKVIVGRTASLRAIKAASAADGRFVMFTQHDETAQEPEVSDLYTTGVMVEIVSQEDPEDDAGDQETVELLIKGIARVKMVGDSLREGVQFIRAQVITEAPIDQEFDDEMSERLKQKFARLVKLKGDIDPARSLSILNTQGAIAVAESISTVIPLTTQQRMEYLQAHDAMEQLNLLFGHLSRLVRELARARRLGRAERAGGDGLPEEAIEQSDVDLLEEALAKKTLPEKVKTAADRAVRRLRKMNPMSSEAAVLRNYVDWINELPWKRTSETKANIKSATKVLNADHFGLDDIKERVLEDLAVSVRVDRRRMPILCLVGPPGVGKTSLGRSIARALDRPFVRLSLGGTRDEAEIRGHRRTYIGAMPGKLISAMKRAGVVDPVIMLDEIDKMSSDSRGDPASALLEVLDPEQNSGFSDHFLEVDYDLSKVMFICTANTLGGVPIALRDRLEVITLSGYTEREKLAISRKFLLPRQFKEHGLATAQLSVSDGALTRIIQRHTKESGVRELDRKLAAIARKAARKLAEKGESANTKVTVKSVDTLLGVPPYDFGLKSDFAQVGLVKGLAVGGYGGVMLDIEVVTVPGKGKLVLTGQLGDWLKESATAALTYVRANAKLLGVDIDFQKRLDIHIHYPGNPAKTDGPSAGIAMTTALVSALTGVPVSEELAMTGEVTLRGRVLKIGGLKEKLLAAHRAGITRVIIPQANAYQIPDLPEEVRNGVSILPMAQMESVLAAALVR